MIGVGFYSVLGIYGTPNRFASNEHFQYKLEARRRILFLKRLK